MKRHEHARLSKILSRLRARASIKHETAEHRLREVVDLAQRALDHIEAPELPVAHRRIWCGVAGLMVGLLLGLVI